MIAFVIATVVIVWTVVSNLVESGLEDAESCMGSYGKVSINSLYTCYNSTSGNLQFSIKIKDIELDSILVSISSAGSTKSYTITNEAKTFAHLANYGSGVFNNDSVKMPDKNSGLTYLENTFTETPDLIEIAPIINRKQCEMSDSLSGIDDCLSLA